MPTHFVSQLLENPEMSLKDFAFVCARAFINRLRESPDIPLEHVHFNADPHYQEVLTAAKEHLKKLQSLNHLEWDLEKEQWNATERTLTLRRMIQEDKQHRLFHSMIVQVQDWDAPESCIGLKQFMLNQLESSKRSLLSLTDFKPRLFDSTEEYKEYILKEQKELILSRERGVDEEEERTYDLNKWLDDISQSLGDGCVTC